MAGCFGHFSRDFEIYLYQNSLRSIFLIKVGDILKVIPKRACTQLTFTCSKSILETLEKVMKYVQS